MFFSIKELVDMGITLPKKPSNIKISKKASLYNAHLMRLGDNIRIDDFCILSGNIKIGSFIHIGAFCALYGGNKVSKDTGIVIENFCTLSPKAMIFASSDDFSGEFLISPIVSSDFSNVTNAKVLLKEHTSICANAIILPGVVCEVGSVLGAMSLLKNNTESFSIYTGIPAFKVKNRSKKLLKLEKEFLSKFELWGGVKASLFLFIQLFIQSSIYKHSHTLKHSHHISKLLKNQQLNVV